MRRVFPSAAWTALAALLVAAGHSVWPGARAGQGAQGFFVLVVNDGNNGTVYRAERDGTGLRQLTAGHGCRAFGPTVSPGGTLIFYSTWDRRQQKMWRVNADGTGRRCVTASHHNEANGSFSPDGKRIVFDSNRGAFGRTRTRLWTMALDGSDLRTVTQSPLEVEHCPSYSPDGQQIVCTGFGAGTRGTSVWVYDLRTRRRRSVASPPSGSYFSDPRFSPDGRKILAAARWSPTRGELYLIDVATLSRQRLAPWCPAARVACFVDGGRAVAYIDARDYAVYIVKLGRQGHGRALGLPGRKLDEFTFWEPAPTR